MVWCCAQRAPEGVWRASATRVSVRVTFFAEDEEIVTGVSFVGGDQTFWTSTCPSSSDCRAYISTRVSHVLASGGPPGIALRGANTPRRVLSQNTRLVLLLLRLAQQTPEPYYMPWCCNVVVGVHVGVHNVLRFSMPRGSPRVSR